LFYIAPILSPKLSIMKNLLTLIFFCLFGQIIAQNDKTSDATSLTDKNEALEAMLSIDELPFIPYFTITGGFNVIDNTLLSSGWSANNLNWVPYAVNFNANYFYFKYLSVGLGSTINSLQPGVLQQDRNINESKFYWSIDAVNPVSFSFSGFSISLPAGASYINCGGEDVVAFLAGTNFQYASGKMSYGVDLWYKKHALHEWLGKSHGQVIMKIGYTF